MFRNVGLNDVDSNGNSPLHIAVMYGRAKNAEVLLRSAKEKSESNDADDQLIYEKFGLASINQMNKSRYYPLHLAVLNDHLVKFVFLSLSLEEIIFSIPGLRSSTSRLWCTCRWIYEYLERKINIVDVSLSKRIFTNCQISH